MVRHPTKVFGDNLAANKLTKEHFISTGNQHIYVPYFWIQELVKNGELIVPHVATKQNVADLHTKSVPREVIRALRDKACGYDPAWLASMHEGDSIAVTNMCERIPDGTERHDSCWWCYTADDTSFVCPAC